MRFHSIFFLFFTTKFSFSQLEFGIKGGLNFDAAGYIIVVARSISKTRLFEGQNWLSFGRLCQS